MLKASKTLFKSHNLYLTGLVFIALGLSLSKPAISIGQMILVLAWFLDAGKVEKAKTFFSSKLAWVFISMYVITILGLFYTQDFGFAKDDLRRKLPLFVLPFVLFHKRFSFKELKLIFSIYVSGVVAASFWSVFVKLGGLGIVITDARELSRFNSHIRFGLEICVAIFGSLRFLFLSENRKEKIIWLLISFWLLVFMGVISLITGLLVFLITAFCLLLIYGRKIKSVPIRLAAYIVPIAIVVLGGVKVFKVVNLFQDTSIPLEEKYYTPDYGMYFHDKNSTLKENGFFIWRNNCQKELKKEWNKRSEIKYDENNLKGYQISATIIRFLTSKGVYKNGRSVQALSNKEINAIEHGVTNVKLIGAGVLEKRFYDMAWEYNSYVNGGNYNGHSLVMRLEYWKTAWQIFLKNKLIGVGTGDIQLAFDNQYELNKSVLTEKYRLRAHNQFLTTAATFGVLGLLVFLFFLLYPIFKLKGYNSYLYSAFLMIAILSMFTEDTLDTQVGITFFAFFNTLFLLNREKL